MENNEYQDKCCCAQTREILMRQIITDEEKEKYKNDPVITSIKEQIQKQWNESIKRDLLITQLSTSLLVDIRNMADVLSIDFQDITFEKTNCGTLEELYSIMTEYFKIKDRFDKYDKEMAEMSKPTLQM